MKLSSRTKVSLAIAISLVIGVLIGSIVLSNLFSQRAAGGQKEGLLITGTETIKVIGPDGKMVGEWQGADPPTSITANAIAACVEGADGGSTTPGGVPAGNGDCYSWLNEIEVLTDSGGAACTLLAMSTNCGTELSGATNYPSPIGCSFSGATCTGWTTIATFAPGSFPTSNCNDGAMPDACNVEVVEGGEYYAPSIIVPIPEFVPFDELCTTAFAATDTTTGVTCALPPSTIPTLTPADSLTINIQYTVT